MSEGVGWNSPPSQRQISTTTRYAMTYQRRERGSRSCLRSSRRCLRSSDTMRAILLLRRRRRQPHQPPDAALTLDEIDRRSGDQRPALGGPRLVVLRPQAATTSHRSRRERVSASPVVTSPRLRRPLPGSARSRGPHRGPARDRDSGTNRTNGPSIHAGSAWRLTA